MIKHIVIWKLKEEANGNPKEENMLAMKSKLDALTTKVPGIKFLQVGLRGADSPANNDDVVLVSEFATWADLDTYNNHPEHLKVVEFVKSVVEKRTAVDFVF